MSDNLALFALHEENMMILRTIYQMGRLPKQEADSVISELDELFLKAVEDEGLSKKKQV